MGEVNIKYSWYKRIVIAIGILYIVFVTILLIGKKEPIEQEIILGPDHNYEVPTEIKFVSDDVYEQNMLFIDSLEALEHVITEEGIACYSNPEEQ